VVIGSARLGLPTLGVPLGSRPANPIPAWVERMFERERPLLRRIETQEKEIAEPSPQNASLAIGLSPRRAPADGPGEDGRAA
jgi:hypothetical protein